MDINKIINIIRDLNEEGIANTVGGGNIAGTVEAGDDPPVKKKKRYIYGRGYRKLWQQK
jgi:hypothetical protein